MDTAGTIDLSIIIISYNTCNLLDECLASTHAKPCRLALEVIVVDNASSDGSPDMVTSKWPLVTLIRNSANQGFAKANNQALRTCRGRLALLLNSDTQVRGDALEAMVTFLDSHPQVGILGPQLLNPDGTLQPSGNRMPSMFNQIWWSLPFHRIFGAESWRSRYLDHHRNYNQLIEVDEVSGAALLVRRAVWESIGLLDEEYFFYFEDIDFCTRAKKAGWRVIYLPEAKIMHYWGMSSKKAGLTFHPRSISGQFHYMRKIHGRSAELTLRLVTAIKAFLKLLLLLPVYAARSEDRKQMARTNMEIFLLSIGLKKIG
jgi:N-acetylglucosaminyl-diphospho-decaprenol L-rhamnosyltransferase